MKIKVNKTFIATILFFISAQVISSQSGWVKQFGGPTENLNKVYFTDANNGIITGNNGTILFTENGGSNWVKQPSVTINNLTSISFIGSNNGFILGEGKTLLKTVDGGKNWLNLSDSIPSSLASVSFIDSLSGFAIFRSDSTIVLKTSNGGYNWEEFSTINYQYLDPIFIKCLSNNVIIAGGYYINSLIIFKSLDGGNTWEEKADLYTSYLEVKKIQFISSNRGFILTNTKETTGPYVARIYKTIDAGNNWIVQSANLPRLQNLFMVDENIGYTIGDPENRNYSRNTIFKTTDGGKNWDKQNTFSDHVLNDTYFTDSNNGTIVGDGGLILRTTTGGVKQVALSNWEIQPSGVTGNLRRIYLLNDCTGYSLGYGLLKTSDCGISWTQTGTVIYGNDDYDIWFSDPSNGIISALYDVYTTTNGGTNWEKAKTADHLFGAFCTDNLHRIVVGWGGTIKYTLDGSKVWNSANSGTSSHLRDVHFVNKELGYVVGDEGTILRSEDKGITWKTLDSKITNALTGVYFTNNEVGIVIGAFGTILRTSDGGATWELQNSGTYSDLNSVFFKDNNNGLIVGELGVILRTNDGGENWKLEESGINSTLYGLAIKNSVELAVGDGGIILRNISDSGFIDTTKNVPSIKQNYPNPFNPGTTIEYSIPKQTHVALKIYDILGREVFTLVNEEKVAGNYEVNFDGINMPSGVYFYSIRTGSYSSVKKMILLR